MSNARKNHKWDGKLGKHNKKGYIECVICGCTKQREYGYNLYFVDYTKEAFVTSPSCYMVKNKLILPFYSGFKKDKNGIHKE